VARQLPNFRATAPLRRRSPECCPHNPEAFSPIKNVDESTIRLNSLFSLLLKLPFFPFFLCPFFFPPCLCQQTRLSSCVSLSPYNSKRFFFLGTRTPFPCPPLPPNKPPFTVVPDWLSSSSFSTMSEGPAQALLDEANPQRVPHYSFQDTGVFFTHSSPG